MGRDREFTRRDLFGLGRKRLSQSNQPKQRPKESTVVEGPPPSEEAAVQIETGPEFGPQIVKRIEAEPACRRLLYQLLEFCAEPRSSSEIHYWMAPFPEMKSGFHTPGMLLGWMVQAGAIAPSPGEQSEKESDDPEWRTTDAGCSAVRQNDASARLSALVSEMSPESAPYREVLEFCRTPRSREEIETLLQPLCASRVPVVYPSYFIEQLEAVGGLEWDGRWLTTAEGLRQIGSEGV